MLIKINNALLLSICIFIFSIVSSSAIADELNDQTAPYQFTDAGLGNIEITSIVGASDKIYVATPSKLFIKVKNDSNFKEYDASGINSSDLIKNIAVDSGETVYVATGDTFLIGNKRIDMLNMHTYSFTAYRDINGPQNATQANSVVIDQKGNIYIGTNVGLIAPKVHVQYHYFYPRTKQYSFQKILSPTLQDKLVIDGLYVDKDGLLYVGTNGSGLFIMKQMDVDNPMTTTDYACGVKCKHLNLSSQDSTIDIKCIYVKNRIIYVGTNQGLYIGKVINGGDSSSINNYQFVDAGMHSVLSNVSINSIYVDDAGKIYVGIGEANALNGLDLPYSLIIGKKQADDTYSFTPIDKKQLNANAVKSIYVDSDGKMYVGTEHGLYIGIKTTSSDMIYSEITCPETIVVQGDSTVPASIFLSQVSEARTVTVQNDSAVTSSFLVRQTSKMSMSPIYGLYFRGIPGGLGGYTNSSHEPVMLQLIRGICYGNIPVCDYERPSNAIYGRPAGPGYQADSSTCSSCSLTTDNSLLCGRRSDD